MVPGGVETLEAVGVVVLLRAVVGERGEADGEVGVGGGQGELCGEIGGEWGDFRFFLFGQLLEGGAVDEDIGDAQGDVGVVLFGNLGIEGDDAAAAPEVEGAVAVEGGVLVEEVIGQAVCYGEDAHASGFASGDGEAGEALVGAEPEVAVVVFFDAADHVAGQVVFLVDGAEAVCGGVVEAEAAAFGACPDASALVGEEAEGGVGGQEAVADAVVSALQGVGLLQVAGDVEDAVVSGGEP